MIASIAFYLFAALTILPALAVIFARNPVHSVLWLILAFFNAAGLMLLALATVGWVMRLAMRGWAIARYRPPAFQRGWFWRRSGWLGDRDTTVRVHAPGVGHRLHRRGRGMRVVAPGNHEETPTTTKSPKKEAHAPHCACGMPKTGDQSRWMSAALTWVGRVRSGQSWVGLAR